MDTLGLSQRALEFAHGDVRVLFDEFEEKATVWTRFARSRRTSAFGGGERLAAAGEQAARRAAWDDRRVIRGISTSSGAA